MEFDVITFGSAVVDVFVHTDIAESDNFLHYPIGAKILIKKLKFDIGGGGTNTPVAFARLGLKTGAICKLGDDENSHRILNLLKKEKIYFLGKIDKKEMTGYSIILDSKGGERTILTYKGANNNVSINDIKINQLKAKWLYFSALLEKSFETQKKLAFKLVRQKTKLAFNPSSYMIEKLDLTGLLKICDVLILNKEEAEMLCKKNAKHSGLLEELSSLGPKIIVITNKDKETLCYDGIKKYSIMPHKIKVVERTGAGDAFASGFVAGCIVGHPIEKCLKLGLEESENVIKYFGAKNNLLRRNLKR